MSPIDPVPRERPAVADALLRVAGGLLAFLGGLVLAVLAVLLVPLRLDTPVGTVRLPVAVLLVLCGSLLLLWFAREATGVRWGVLLPAAGWFPMILVAIGTTRDGSRLLMPDDWVAGLTLFGGTLVLVIGMVVTLTTRPRTRP